MSAGHLKITGEKVVFVHTKSGRKDTVKVGKILHPRRSQVVH